MRRHNLADILSYKARHPMSLAAEIAPHLPYLRRYARALTGSQSHGDTFVRAALETIVEAPEGFPRDVDARVGLYKVFHAIWSTANIETGSGDESASSFERMAQNRLAAITPLSRQALLLTAMEGFSNDDVAYLIDATTADVSGLVAEALAEIDRQTATRVLIIEDEPIIALDLENLVTELGHKVVATAATRADAVAKAHSEKPGLVLADINLGEGGSGIDAVAEILNSFDIPVIFITAYPEKLLTGERPEPTYLIAKPFLPETVQATVGQALFFHSAARKAA